MWRTYWLVGPGYAISQMQGEEQWMKTNMNFLRCQNHPDGHATCLATGREVWVLSTHQDLVMNQTGLHVG
jgi:hypothetical protein